jgi:chitin disaccharide deacetylase
MQIIFNADDFGISEEVNSSVLWLHEKGIISSASIIAQSRSAIKAMNIARKNPDLDIGVHLCLDGNLNIGTDYKTLLDKNTGHFFPCGEISRRIVRNSFDKDEIFREYCLQIERILDSGIRVSHLDHHHHMHLYLPILILMIRAAKKYKIRFIRSQKIYLPIKHSYLNVIYRNLHQVYLKNRYKTSDGYFEPGIRNISDKEKFYVRFSELLKNRDKVIEIILHPKLMCDSETNVFSSDRLRAMLAGHEITSYHNIDA